MDAQGFVVEVIGWAVEHLQESDQKEKFLVSNAVVTTRRLQRRYRTYQLCLQMALRQKGTPRCEAKDYKQLIIRRSAAYGNLNC